MRRALGIDEKSYGPDHPNVATYLNNLALLLKATNRLGEAEPILARSLVILLKFTRLTAHRHPHVQSIFGNYIVLLRNMECNDEEINNRVWAVGRAADFNADDYRKLLDWSFE